MDAQFEEEEEVAPGGARVVPEDMLQTDTRVGLTSEEVLQRRRKYGLNQMKYVDDRRPSRCATLCTHVARLGLNCLVKPTRC